jgi:hypothetical protein
MGSVEPGSRYLPSILDLRTHLAERSSRLRTLIILLNEYDLVPKVCYRLDEDPSS